jgi:hypothetical protein
VSAKSSLVAAVIHGAARRIAARVSIAWRDWQAGITDNDSE